eukprot:GHVT01087547.1.p1 GENE.GHVT01087547.1~~GHVT01087547.1.p1  ORF type:complete len:142 (+),score=13.72 GHVT01087547.1:2271-2696(+)
MFTMTCLVLSRTSRNRGGNNDMSIDRSIDLKLATLDVLSASLARNYMRRGSKKARLLGSKRIKASYRTEARRGPLAFEISPLLSPGRTGRRMEGRREGREEEKYRSKTAEKHIKSSEAGSAQPKPGVGSVCFNFELTVTST